MLNKNIKYLNYSNNIMRSDKLNLSAINYFSQNVS